MASKSMIAYKRRLEVKKEYLKGKNIEDMAFQFDVAESTIRSDIRKINKEYIKQVQNNPHILEKQVGEYFKYTEKVIIKIVHVSCFKVYCTSRDIDSGTSFNCRLTCGGTPLKDGIYRTNFKRCRLTHVPKVVAILKYSKYFDN